MRVIVAISEECGASINYDNSPMATDKLKSLTLIVHKSSEGG
jgi:hypothetical protein